MKTVKNVWLKKFINNPKLLIFSFVFLLGLMYAFLQPIYGVSDEPAHVVKAVASGRGEFDGPKVTGQFGYGAYEYEVPAAYDSIWNFVCYNGDVNITPACSEGLTRDRTLVSVSSTAGSYPPIYYASIGWIGNIVVGPWGVYLMRSATSFVIALIFALSFSQSLKFLTINRAKLAALIAFTPAVAAFAGTVNPFSVEVAAATLFWTSSIALLTCQDKKGRFADNYLLVIAAVLLAIVRPVSFFWIAVIEIFLLAFFFNTQKIQIETRKRNDQIVIASAAFLLSFGINIMREGITNFGASSGVGGSTIENMRISFERSEDYVRQLFGFFGWTHFYPPIFVPLIFCGVAIYVGSQIINRSRRQLLCLLLFVIFIIFSPTVLEGYRASSSGWGYQGRYMLPVAVGLPFLFFNKVGPFDQLKERELTTRWPIFAIAIAHLLAVVHVARRFFVGLNGPYIWFVDPRWTGYGGVPLAGILLGLTVMVTILLVQNRGQADLDQLKN